MAKQKRGQHSFAPQIQPVLLTWSSVGGKKEAQGPLGNKLDKTFQDTHFGEKTWEQAERKMQETALQILMEKAEMPINQLDVVFSGDLLNQCISSSFPLRNQDVPHLGLYGACSTMAESLLMAALTIGGGYADHVAAMTSSHFAASERQYRFPLSYGGQRTPNAQWTVTGAGAVLVGSQGTGPRIEGCTIGTVNDLGITDAANMGAAMAPAACHTIRTHLQDFQASIDDYDAIITGDLGQIGRQMLLELASESGLDLEEKLIDCGMLVFDNTRQDVHAGGSGCGCSAITLCSHFLPKLANGSLSRILFCGTGALLSPTSTQQGEPIPGICHAVSIWKGN